MAKKYTVSVTAVEQLSLDVRGFRCAFDTNSDFHFLAGQFVMVNLHDADKKPVRRAYSIASSPKNTKQIELCVKIYPEGKASTIFETMNIGQQLDIEGPYGKFTLHDATPELVFIGAGAGLAPLRSMIHHVFETGTKKKITLFFGFRSEHDFLYKEELTDLAKHHPNFKLIVSASQPQTTSWRNETGRINLVLPKYLKDTTPDKEFYICGPSAMVHDTIKALEDLGCKREQIYIDAWG